MSRAEQAETDDLAPLPAAEEAALLTALEAALRPTELSVDVNERLIELALEDPLAPPSAAELVESERLRSALDEGIGHEDAALLVALRLGRDRDREGAREASDRALERALSAPVAPPRRNVIYAVFGAGGLLAAAAAALLLVAPRGAPDPAFAADYARPRSTAPLFSERFETGETSARIDLIASSRSRDLRDNRYAAWGVR